MKICIRCNKEEIRLGKYCVDCKVDVMYENDKKQKARKSLLKKMSMKK